METTETELSSGRGLYLPNIPSTEGSPSAASAQPGEPEGPLIPGRDSRREQDSHHFWCWRWVSPTGGGASERVGQGDGAEHRPQLWVSWPWSFSSLPRLSGCRREIPCPDSQASLGAHGFWLLGGDAQRDWIFQPAEQCSFFKTPPNSL